MKLARLLMQKIKRKPHAAEMPRLPSLLKAMRCLVSRSVLREVVASSSDRRQWSVLAAAWVGVSEAEFMREAAREMGLEFEERVPVPDLAVFQDEAREVVQALRRCGCSVVLDGATPVRFVAVDPAEVRALSTYTGKEPVTVASWGEISRALDGAERIVAEAEANADLLEDRHEDDLCGKIFEILVREAVQHGSTAVEVLSDDERTRYQFTTSDGKTGVGALRRDAVPALLRHLLRADGTTRSMSGREVFVRSLGNLRNFRLSWSAAAARSDELLEAPCPSQLPSETQLVSQAAAVPLLVIDDNPMFCRVLDRLLRKEGFDPCFAENGAVALERLQASENFRPRAIICDLHMPLMNGRDLLQRVKSDERLSSIPVVMLTSDEDVEAEVSLLQTGAAAFLSKAKDPRVLSAQIRKLTAARTLPEAA